MPESSEAGSVVDPPTTPMPPLELRRLATPFEYAQAVELQRVTWGSTFRDVVPAALLKVTQRVGGLAAGAFGPEGELFGFVYGLAGQIDGHPVHWSHMLAVLPEYRDHGIGRRLKEYQRELVRAAGYEWIYWTVDPLVARNAHLNVNRLAVQVREYVPDMYGDTGSDLHAFGTDRFVVAWPLQSNGNHGATTGDHEAVAPILNVLDDEAIAQMLTERPALVRIEIPHRIESEPVTNARSWRRETRRAFLVAFGCGYQVESFRCAADGRCFYLLAPSEP